MRAALLLYTCCMSWAAKRRLVIVLILVGVAALISGLFLYLALRTPPTCVDGVKNGEETGVDCGLSCPYLCTEEQAGPTVLYTLALPGREGETDIAALVENKNAAAAAKAVPYRLTLYGEGQTLIQEVIGSIDLPPGRSQPVYVPNVFSGKQEVTSAFLSIDPSEARWFSLVEDPRILPAVSGVEEGSSTSTPRVEATLRNPSASVLRNVRVLVFVHGESGRVIAASQTIVPSIPGQDEAIAVFTWSAAFSEKPASFQVLPVVPLP